MEANKADSVAIPPLDILKIQLLNRRDAVLSAIEAQEERRLRTDDPETGAHKARAKILSFFYAVEPMIKRWVDRKEYTQLKEDVLASYEKSLIVFRRVSELLDQKHITKIDMEKAYDSTNIEQENSVKGV
jgi:hypothetical protein